MIPRPRLTAAAAILLTAVLTSQMLSSGTTQAKWSAAATTAPASLNYGQVTLGIADNKVVLKPYATLTNSQKFGIAYRPLDLTIDNDPALATWTTAAEASAFRNQTLRVKADPTINCSSATPPWTISSGYSNTITTRPYTVAPTPYAVPVAPGASKNLCVFVYTGMTNLSFYQRWAGREFRLTTTVAEQTPGEASWNKQETWTSRLVVPIPPPVPRNNNINCYQDFWSDTQIFWRWPDQSSDSGTGTAINKFQIYIRPTSTNGPWTFLKQVSGTTRNVTLSGQFDYTNTAGMTAPGDYQLRIVAFPFQDESKYMAAQYVWNVRSFGSNDWGCGTNADPSLETTARTEAPVGYAGYESTWPTFPATFGSTTHG